METIIIFMMMVVVAILITMVRTGTLRKSERWIAFMLVIAFASIVVMSILKIKI